MLDPEVVFAGVGPQNAAQIPAAGKARVERERPVHQPDHRSDILAEISQHVGGVSQNARVVLRRLERPPSEIDALAAVWFRRFGPAVNDEPHVAVRRPGECWPIMPIDPDRLLEQSQGLEHPLSRYRIEDGKRTQVEIIGAEVGCRPRGRAAHLGRLQRRLDHPGNADRDPVLQLEDIFQRAVEAVRP